MGDSIDESICFICLDRTSTIETAFIRDFLTIPCKCAWASHVFCYEEWAKTTDMICPYCRLKDDYNYFDNDEDVGQEQEQLPPPPNNQEIENIGLVEVMNRNRLNLILMIRCVDISGFIFIIMILYILLTFMNLTIKNNFRDF